MNDPSRIRYGFRSVLASNNRFINARLFSLKRMEKFSLFELVPEDLPWPWHKPSKPEDASKRISQK